MEIGLKYNIKVVEEVSDIISTDFWMLEKLSSSMIPVLKDPLKFSSTCSVFVKKGHASIDIDVMTFQVEAPAIVNIRHSQFFNFSEVSDDFDSSFIVISKRFCDNLFPLIKESPAYAIASREPIVNIPGELVSRFEDFYKRLSSIFNGPKTSNSSRALLYSIASFFYEAGTRCYEPLLEKVAKPQTRLQEKFIMLVQENFKKEKFLDFYARELGVTPKHLSRTVKSLTGMTAVEWIDRYVILEAKVLLKSTNLNIQQIADHLNFQSQSLFGKYFKKHTGLSPKEFRNI